ncbi:MFS general substrate transporter, partial [Aureobasidium melanogenum]
MRSSKHERCCSEGNTNTGSLDERQFFRFRCYCVFGDNAILSYQKLLSQADALVQLRPSLRNRDLGFAGRSSASMRSFVGAFKRRILDGAELLFMVHSIFRMDDLHRRVVEGWKDPGRRILTGRKAHTGREALTGHRVRMSQNERMCNEQKLIKGWQDIMPESRAHKGLVDGPRVSSSILASSFVSLLSNPDYELENCSQDRDKSAEDKPSLGLGREIIFVAVICNAQLLTQAALGISIAPLHIIGGSFGASDAQLPWFPAAYSLTVGTFILFAGRLGDLFGHRRLFVAGWIWFALWSLIAGVAVYSNQIFSDICRALQGIGPAVLLPNALAILGRTYPPGGRKDMIFSIFGATAPGGFLLGAVFSSMLAQLAWWPWGYWILCIYCILLSGASFIVIPSDDPISWPIPKEKFDIPGTTVGVLGLVFLNVAWNQAGVVGWREPMDRIQSVTSIIGAEEVRRSDTLRPRLSFGGLGMFRHLGILSLADLRSATTCNTITSLRMVCTYCTLWTVRCDLHWISIVKTPTNDDHADSHGGSSSCPGGW